MKFREYHQKIINIISLIIVMCIIINYSTIVCFAITFSADEAKVQIVEEVHSSVVEEKFITQEIIETTSKIEDIVEETVEVSASNGAPANDSSVVSTEQVTEKDEVIEAPSEDTSISHSHTKYLTKSGGIYCNPYTGLKETWYSQRVLPGRGLEIPGRHVNEEGFVCDGEGYICVASSTYPKGTIIETSRGMGKVYDSGCKEGILDVYTNW